MQRGVYVSEADAEVFRFFRRGNETREVPLEDSGARRRKLRAEYLARIQEERVCQLRRLSQSGWRAGIGMVFLGAIPREQVTAKFGLVAALVCFLWAWHHYRKEGAKYGKNSGA